MKYIIKTEIEEVSEYLNGHSPIEFIRSNKDINVQTLLLHPQGFFSFILESEAVTVNRKLAKIEENIQKAGFSPENSVLVELIMSRLKTAGELFHRTIQKDQFTRACIHTDDDVDARDANTMKASLKALDGLLHALKADDRLPHLEADDIGSVPLNHRGQEFLVVQTRNSGPSHAWKAVVETIQEATQMMYQLWNRKLFNEEYSGRTLEKKRTIL